MCREVIWVLDKSAKAASDRIPSPNLRTLFLNVKRLRGWLRKKKQDFIVSTSENKKKGLEKFERMCDKIRERGDFLRGMKVEVRRS